MQNTANSQACRQGNHSESGDPLTMPNEPVDHDTKPAAEAGDSHNRPESLGLSQILARVLQQLSISAWVPAAMLVANIAVLVELRDNKSYNIALAVKDLAAKPLGILIILAFSLILATVVTQAFEFEFIRFLEGYFDSANGFIQAIMSIRIRRHVCKRQRLAAKLRKANRMACHAALPEMRKFPKYDKSLIDQLLEDLSGGEDRGGQREARAETAVAQANKSFANWKQQAPPAAQYRIDSTTAKFRSYPEENRVLPTRLGNVLRAAEDQIDLGESENLEGYVLRHYEEISSALKSQHDDYRARLDMYCCLVLVFVALLGASAITLIGVHPFWGMAIAIATYGFMSFISYQAAIASAHAYGLILQEIPNYLSREDAASDQDGPSALEKLLLSLLHRNAT
jgi:hypothetical protein